MSVPADSTPNYYHLRDEELRRRVDVYMPDVKWSDDAAAVRYSKASGYGDTVRESLREMHRQVGDLRLDDRGLATGGLLMRHLVMPNHVESGKRVVEFLAEALSRDTFVDVMAQYTPHYEAKTEDRYEEIGRDVTPEEYRAVVEHARDVGLDRLYLDDGMLRQGSVDGAG